MYMNRKKNSIAAFCATLLVTLALLTSCLGGDDDEVVYTHDAAITSFSLGTLNNYVYVSSSTGADSLVKTTVTGSNYKFRIDQLKHEIYNTDSLPYGTDVAHVICTIGSRNSSIITIQNVDSDSLKYFSSSDSIDFTVPRTFRTYSSAGTDAVAYTISVNVHQQRGDDFNWTLVDDGAGDTPFGTDGYRGLVPFGNSMLVLSGNVLYKAEDWSETPQWSKVCDIDGIRQLAGASPSRLFAIDDAGTLVASANAPETWSSGIDWQAETLDDDAALMANTEVRVVSVPSKTNPDTYHLVLVGRNSRLNTTDNVAVWSKVEEYGAYAQQTGWFYYPPAAIIKYPMPALANLQLAAYDDGILALGTTDDGELSTLRFSRDMGITWPVATAISLPDGFAPTTTAYAMTTDSNNYLWIADGSTGKVWRGRQNRLGWEEDGK